MVGNKTKVRTYGTCPKCRKPISSRNFKRHLKSHRLSKVKIEMICKSFYKNPAAGEYSWLCDICNAVVQNLRRHRHRFHPETIRKSAKELNNPADNDTDHETDHEDENDPPASPEESENIKDRYPSLLDLSEKERRKPRFSYLPHQERFLEKLTSTLICYQTQEKDRSPLSSTVLATKAFIRRLHSRTCQIIGKMAGARDIFNSTLFLDFELRDHKYEVSSRTTVCSQFVTLCEAALWVKENLQAEKAMVLDDVSVGELRMSIDAINESRYINRCMLFPFGPIVGNKRESRKIELSHFRCIQRRAREEIAENATFTRCRNFFLVALMSLNPLRDQPFCEIKVKALKQPSSRTPGGTTLHEVRSNVRPDANAYSKCSRPRILRMTASLRSMAQIVLKKHRSLPAHAKMTQKQWLETPVFCTTCGTPFTQMTPTIKTLSRKITGTPFTCSDYRRGIIEICEGVSNIGSIEMSIMLTYSTSPEDKLRLQVQNRNMDRFLQIIHLE